MRYLQSPNPKTTDYDRCRSNGLYDRLYKSCDADDTRTGFFLRRTGMQKEYPQCNDSEFRIDGMDFRPLVRFRLFPLFQWW